MKNNSNNKLGCLGAIIILGIVSMFLEKIGVLSDKDEDTTQYVESSERNTTEKELTEKEKFVLDFDGLQSEEVASKIYDIYKDKLGFTSIQFKENQTGTFNYTIAADGYGTMITVIDNNDYRIFYPNTDYVLYENGEVITDAAYLHSVIADHYELDSYYIIAKTEIEKCLKNPKSADFPSVSEISYQKKDNLIAIKGYVSAKNSFNAVVNSEYIIQFLVNDLDNWDYVVNYIEIDGEKQGEFIEY